MKPLFALLVLATIGCGSLLAQAPLGVNYQAIARDASGAIMASQTLNTNFKVRAGSASGAVVFEENHTGISTNQFGLFSLEIGTGTNVVGSLGTVAWATNTFWLEVSVNGASMGAQQLVSVPYALMARDVENDQVDDADADPANELQTITYNSGNGELSLSGGNTVTLIDKVNDADADATNELQTLSYNSGNNELTLSSGNTVTLVDNVNDADFDPANEIQSLSLAGDTIRLTGGGEVVLGLHDPRWDTSQGNVHRTSGAVGIGTADPKGSLHVSNDTSLGDTVGIVMINANNNLRNNALFARGAFPSSSTIFTESRLSGFGILEGALVNYGVYGFLTSGYSGSAATFTTGPRVDSFTARVNLAGSNGISSIIGNKLGIGTSTPQSLLHVQGGSIQLEPGTSTKTGLHFGVDPFGSAGDSALISYFSQGGNNSSLRIMNNDDADDDISFHQFGAERMVIVDGHVGIGVAAPTAQLHIHGGLDAGLGTLTGDLVLGATTAQNIVMDEDEIQARDNGKPSTLQLNPLGRVAIGTSLAASEVLDVDGNISADAFIAKTSNGVLNAGGGKMDTIINYIGDVYNAPTNVDGDEDLYIDDDLQVGGLAFKPGGGSWTTPSDMRLKRNIQPFTDGLTAIMAINPVRYQYNETYDALYSDREFVGILAQDIKDVAPYTVELRPFGRRTAEDSDGVEHVVEEGTPYYTYDDSAIKYILINAIKEQQTIIEQLTQRIEQLEAK